MRQPQGPIWALCSLPLNMRRLRRWGLAWLIGGPMLLLVAAAIASSANATEAATAKFIGTLSATIIAAGCISLASYVIAITMAACAGRKTPRKVNLSIAIGMPAITVIIMATLNDVGITGALVIIGSATLAGTANLNVLEKPDQ